MDVVRDSCEPWTVRCIDTGATTQTGGRLRRALEHVGDAPFCLTYGDGVGDIDVTALVKFHESHGKLVTMTAAKPSPRFGGLRLDEDRVVEFEEKAPGSGAWVNAGFFVVSPGVVDYLDGDDTVWEREPLERLTAAGELMAYRHSGFWHPMDTIRDRRYLEELWLGGSAPWAAGW
jgi:glucose-1-phosphate cytidylyltransferase